MIIPKTVMNLWMQAYAARALDSEVTIAGNGHSPDAVIATLRFVIWECGWPLQVEPTRDRLIEWMENNNMAHEVEYLMEE